MAQLDRLLAVMISRSAETLTLDEGTPACLDVSGDDRIVTRTALTGQQIAALVREVAPDGALALLEPGHPVQFRYVSGAGAWVARVSRDDGRWSASITSDVRRAPADAAPVDVAAEEHIVLTEAHEPISVTPPSGRQSEIDALLSEAVRRGASDLHVRSQEPPMVRCDGEIVRLDSWPTMTAAYVRGLIDATMPARNRDEFADSGDTDFAYDGPEGTRFRVNVFSDRKGSGAVFRQIPPIVVTAEQLGLSAELQRLTQLRKGLVIVTGPTGSGKSTTLCALVDLANRTRSDHIVTIEDPIEFIHESKRCIVTQRQVGQHTRSFKAALRAALREDPDVVLIGEMRDLETVSIALETAETGHLVFATLHTTTAAGTVDRIIDQFPSAQQEQTRVMLADSLRAVLSQTLCKRIGGGRVAAREVLFNTPSVANLIRERKTFQIPSIMQTSKRFGMVTFNDALVELIESRQVAAEEAYTHAVDRAAFVGALKAKGIDVSFADAEALNARMNASSRQIAG